MVATNPGGNWLGTRLLDIQHVNGKWFCIYIALF